MKPYTKTRTHQDPLSRRWTVQGWWPDSQVWADIGDPVDTQADAIAKEQELGR